MNLELTPAEDLSLQHLLENGLAILDQQSLHKTRRIQTLEGLSRIFSEADSASQALHAQNLLFGVEQRPALERFSLFFRRLDRYFGESLSDRLEEASDVFIKLKKNKKPTKGACKRARELIERLLSAFNEERSMSPLEAPQFFNSLG